MLFARRCQGYLRVHGASGHKKTRSKAGLLPFANGLLDAFLQTALKRVFIIPPKSFSNLGEFKRNMRVNGVIQATGDEVYPTHDPIPV